MLEVKLDIYQTLAMAIFVYYLGRLLKAHISVLSKYCIPSPVIGGIIFALLNTVLTVTGVWTYGQDLIMQNFFMNLFFTSVGYTASFHLLKVGGKNLVKMVILAAVLIVLQDVVGVALAGALGKSSLLGLALGSVPLVGGHGTSGSFGPVIESMGLQHATTIAFAAATYGLVAGGLLGGPLAERLIVKYQLSSEHPEKPADEIEAATSQQHPAQLEKKQLVADNFMHALGHLLLALGIGTIVSKGLMELGVVFPGYIGAMLVAALLRNISDKTGLYPVYEHESTTLGGLGLNIFLSLALMSLQLQQLIELALPLLLILLTQTVVIAFYAYFIVFRVMGRDYEAAVMASGICGFGMGATPNAIANMNAICARFTPAPTAFLVIPLVGALFVDFFNASIVTLILNLVR